jgi:[acyl-carrier-protein] S-malonyltransferase
MQAAADAAESGMVSVIGLDSDTVAKICAAANEKIGSNAVQIANYLCPGNYVVSGSLQVCRLQEVIESECCGKASRLENNDMAWK